VGSAALIVKRLHDRDKSALWYPLFGLAPALCYHLGVVYSSNISNVLSPTQQTFWLLGGILWVWAIVELGFMPGTKGPNRYGPDPRGAEPGPGRDIADSPFRKGAVRPYKESRLAESPAAKGGER
jgi:uncharacterized membrane protein YhaH (DUF805 family)